jgi:hypothetical protein
MPNSIPILASVGTTASTQHSPTPTPDTRHTPTPDKRKKLHRTARLPFQEGPGRVKPVDAQSQRQVLIIIFVVLGSLTSIFLACHPTPLLTFPFASASRSSVRLQG